MRKAIPFFDKGDLVTPCARVQYIFTELSTDPTPEHVEKLTAEIGLPELNEVADHLEECPVCDKLFSDTFSSDPQLANEKRANLLLAIMTLFAGIDTESAQEKAAREAMLAELDAVEREDEETVRKFVEDRATQLAPEWYRIPMERYRYAVFFLAANAIGMLLQRTARHTFNNPNVEFGLADDGAIFHEEKVCFAGEQVQQEIARMIRDAQSESDELDLETAANLARWIMNALGYGNWNIIPGYSGSIPEDLHKLHVITLKPNDKLDGDPLEGWR